MNESSRLSDAALIGVVGALNDRWGALSQVLDTMATRRVRTVYQLGGLFDEIAETPAELDRTLARNRQAVRMVSRVGGDTGVRARVTGSAGELMGETAHATVLGRADRDQLFGGHSVASMSGDGRRTDFASSAEILQGTGSSPADVVLTDLVPALILRGRGAPAVNRRQALLRLRPWAFVGPSPRFVVRDESFRPPHGEPFTTTCIELPRVPDVAVIVDLRKKSIEYIDNRGTRIPVNRDDPPLELAAGGRWLVTAANGRWRLDLDRMTVEQMAGDPTKPWGNRTLVELQTIRIGEQAVLTIAARDGSYTMTENLGQVAAIQPWERD
ncbi:hypothetical protein GCM10010196_02600 [Agromyces mediolanus]|uniref:Uncharacterized protein n=1 Tax=Agromyces mediolanus TaxID=41986 RepID=A0A918F7U5_AGRME|nr:hypothetical protein [Agromyces mediolanus]GGR13544.1 hypothetical protein GCM10010196_02600 [Agromyces mediolanus]GLJ72664.1 hypothetical protein GCM10017583_19200 [Agromyces mediolanus]